MKIAFVHDWFTGIGGDVRVLQMLHAMYPEAPIYCLTQNKKFTDVFLPNARIFPIYKLQAISSKLFIPFMPSLIESIDLSPFDLVVSTGSIFSKGIILRPRTIHLNYCHSPTRQVWDLSHTYKRKIFQHFLRIWDRQASTRVDHYVANSHNTQKRIWKFYRRDSSVIYPPVGSSYGLLSKASRSATARDYFLIVSRLYKHKNIDIAIRAFNKLGWELVIIGDGPERSHLVGLAGPNVHILGNLPDEAVAGYFERCRAFIMPQEEDFGIAPVEAMMHGKPVLALRAGGALEYIQERVNGLFFDDPHEAVLADGVRRIREMQFDAEAILKSVEQFSWQNFQLSFSNIINQITR